MRCRAHFSSNGTDSFTYTVTDNGTTAGANDFKSDTATVTVTVTEVNDEIGRASCRERVDEYELVVIEQNGKEVKGPANESTQTLTITAVGTAAYGTVQITA